MMITKQEDDDHDDDDDQHHDDPHWKTRTQNLQSSAGVGLLCRHQSLLLVQQFDP